MSYKAYSSPLFTAAWNEAVANRTVGPATGCHHCGISQPSTPSCSHNATMTVCAYNTSTPPTSPSCPCPTQTTLSSHASSISSVTDELCSQSLSTGSIGSSSGPSMPFS